MQIVSLGTKVESGGLVKESILQFLIDVKDEELRLREMGLPFEKEEAIVLLQGIYK